MHWGSSKQQCRASTHQGAWGYLVARDGTEVCFNALNNGPACTLVGTVVATPACTHNRTFRIDEFIDVLVDVPLRLGGLLEVILGLQTGAREGGVVFIPTPLFQIHHGLNGVLLLHHLGSNGGNPAIHCRSEKLVWY